MNYIAVLGSGTTPTILDNVTGQISSVMNMMIDIITTVLANPFFAFLMAVGFVSIGLHIFSRVKGASLS